MPRFVVTVERYERHVATYEETVTAPDLASAIAAGVARVCNGEQESDGQVVYCDTPDDSGSLEHPGVTEHEMCEALKRAGVSIDDANGPCVASIRCATAVKL